MSLAIGRGGSTIPLCVPNLGPEEEAEVVKALRSGWVSSAGPTIGEFERLVCEYTGAASGVAVTSGTASLQLALRLAGVRPNEEVLVPALTFIAPAFSCRNLGAWPVAVDIDGRSWQMDPMVVRSFLETKCRRSDAGVYNRLTGRRVACLVPVHLLGHPAPMDELRQVADEFGLPIVEDAAEALGASYERGGRVGGSGRFVCLSFNGNKIVTTGGGGMLLSDDPEVAGRARYLSTQAKDDPTEYIHHEVGYNFRLTSLQAALGIAQLSKIERFLARKRHLRERYVAGLANTRVRSMEPREGVGCSWWLYTVLLPNTVSRRDVQAELAKRGIETRPLWQPVHLSPSLSDSFHEPCPVAEQVQKHALSLPSSTGLADDDIDRVVDNLLELI
jgi:perosamine synthetase